MVDDIKLGDRVMVSDGECGEVLDIKGAQHVYIRLDNTRHMSASIGSLKKIASDVKDNEPHD